MLSTIYPISNAMLLVYQCISNVQHILFQYTLFAISRCYCFIVVNISMYHGPNSLFKRRLPFHNAIFSVLFILKAE